MQVNVKLGVTFSFAIYSKRFVSCCFDNYTDMCTVVDFFDKHQDLLRDSVASAGNDHRLGANEAPPAIISMFIGEELEAVLDSIEKGTPYGKKEHEKMKIGVFDMIKLAPSVLAADFTCLGEEIKKVYDLLD